MEEELRREAPGGGSECFGVVGGGEGIDFRRSDRGQEDFLMRTVGEF